MDLLLDEKLALVTGSTAGIGFAIAEGLARENARVIVNGRTEARVTAAIARIRKKNPPARLEPYAGDLSDAAACEALVVKYPHVDILINNLGIFNPQPFEQISDDEWRRFFEINVLSGVRLSRYYLPGMKKRDWGRIIFISSESAIQIPVEMIHYGFTKTAQLAVSRGLAETTADTGVTVNSVLAGPTASEGVSDFVGKLASQSNQTPAEFEKAFFEKARPTSLLKRFATPEEVANLVVYVSSPLASATNGAALRVDGGVVRSII
jgi:NAD(P)-dependent dehydrogenase (short-subunit alcohol dehydrogenase family)